MKRKLKILLRFFSSLGNQKSSKLFCLFFMKLREKGKKIKRNRSLILPCQEMKVNQLIFLVKSQVLLFFQSDKGGE